MRILKAADLFCGAGGTSTGAEASGAAEVTFAVNHWDVAVSTHSANFPNAKHVNSRLYQVNPSECGKIDLLFASPECTHHSRARGGKPTSDQQRAGAWELMCWVEHHRPAWMVIENVREFEHWGPVHNGRPMKSKRGAFFEAWLAAIRSAGYRVDYRCLNAADYGAATSRERLFVIARKGRRQPVFPEPTHTQCPGGELPGLSLPRWRPAYEVIDWQLPCPSIFRRRRPLVDKTLLRIEAGLRRFVGPFVAQWDHHGGGGDYVRSVDRPIGTLLTKASMGVVDPFVCQFNEGSGRRNHSPVEPLHTITAGGKAFGLSMPYMIDVNHGGADARCNGTDGPLGTVTSRRGVGLVAPYIVPNYSEANGQTPRTHDPDEPMPIVTSHGGGNLAVPFLSSYYGNGDAQSVADPLDTVTTRDRHSLCLALSRGPQDWPPPETDAMRTLQATMRVLGVCDVGFRMLSNPELSAAQGFPSSYIFTGNKSDVTRQIGNSVSPPVAKQITLAIAGD